MSLQASRSRPRRTATATAAIPAITAIAGTNASPASVSRTMVCGSPSVMPAPSPLPRPAKNISTAEPTSAEATAVNSQRHRDTAPASTDLAEALLLVG